MLAHLCRSLVLGEGAQDDLDVHADHGQVPRDHPPHQHGRGQVGARCAHDVKADSPGEVVPALLQQLSRLGGVVGVTAGPTVVAPHPGRNRAVSLHRQPLVGQLDDGALVDGVVHCAAHRDAGEDGLFRVHRQVGHVVPGHPEEPQIRVKADDQAI